MNPLIQLKQATPLFRVAFVLGCFALLPRVQATPDPAAVPGNNAADGANALANVTTGQFNTAFGTNALFSLTTGNNNSAQGNSALFSNVSGSGNVAIGNAALRLNVSANQNTAVGYQALYSNIGGVYRSANTAIGWKALQANTSGSQNTATGTEALSLNTVGHFNTATGAFALQYNLTGAGNTANGYGALYAAQFSGKNTAVGYGALQHLVGGDNNIALGHYAGVNLSSGGSNIYIGSTGGLATECCTIRIGQISQIGQVQSQSRAFIAGIRGMTTGNNNAVPVVIDSAGQLGTVSSSRRFKNEVKAMDKASEAIYALKPVTFHYKSDANGTAQFGLIAEEVAEVNPDLVVRDGNGEIYTVRYDAVNAMLLNEFIKAYRKIEEQGAMIAQQQKQIEALTAGLQKVSAQVEMNRTAPQMAVNNQ